MQVVASTKSSTMTRMQHHLTARSQATSFMALAATHSLPLTLALPLAVVSVQQPPDRSG